jgi:hypothetical protein
MAIPGTEQAPAGEWFIYTAGSVQGPFLRDEMAGYISEGRIGRDTQATRRSPPDWRDAAADPDLSVMFDRPHAAPSPPTPQRGAPQAPRVAAWPSRGEDRRESRQHEAPPAAGPWAKAERPAVTASAEPAPDRSPGGASLPTGDRPKPAVPPRKRPLLLPPSGARDDRASGAPPAPQGRTRPSRSAAARRFLELERAEAERLARIEEERPGPDPVIAGFFSLLLPGIGQFANRQIVKGLLFGVVAILAWSVGLGWIVHIVAAIEAWMGAVDINEKAATSRDSRSRDKRS